MKGVFFIMDDELKQTIKSVLTIGGAIAIACALLDEVTNENDFKKLASGESLQELKMLPDKQEKQENSEHEEERKKYEEEKKKYDEERKKHGDEVTELKRKLAELEGKENG